MNYRRADRPGRRCALQLGASFVARSFSGDKDAAGADDQGGDPASRAPPSSTCISPCVAFNNHDGSTKSFDYVREHNDAVNHLDVITGRDEITADYAPGAVEEIVQHNGAQTPPAQARRGLRSSRPHRRHEVPAGAARREARSSPACSMSSRAHGPARLPQHRRSSRLTSWTTTELCPGAEALEQFNESSALGTVPGSLMLDPSASFCRDAACRSGSRMVPRWRCRRPATAFRSRGGRAADMPGCA